LVQRATDSTWNAGLWDDIELASAKSESIEASTTSLQALPAGMTICPIDQGDIRYELGRIASSTSATSCA
jgi:hypothetical protein